MKYSTMITPEQTARHFKIVTKTKPRQWWNPQWFPIIPEFKTKPRDQHNTPHFRFHWLFFSAWSLDSFDFEISLNISDHWGIGVSGIIPYMRFVVAIPCPPRVQNWVVKNLWRKP